MDYNLKNDYERLAKLNADQKSIIDAAELNGRTSLNEVEEKTFDSLHKEATEVQQMIERKTKLNDAAKAVISDEIMDTTKKSADELIYNKEEYAKVLKKYLAKGERGLTDADYNVLSRAQSTSSTEGGYTIPTELANEIVKGMAQYGGVRENSKVMTTSGGNTLNFAYNDDTANGVGLISEAAAITADDDTVFSQVAFSAYKYGSAVYINRELIEDSAFNIVSYIEELFAERFGRGLNALYTTGTGSSQPKGVAVAAATGVTLADQDAITFSEILTLKHSVDPAYRNNGKFMLNDATLLAIKKLSIGSGDARPLWQPSFAIGQPETIDGSQFIINQDMNGLGSLKTPMLYGDFSKFMIRDVAGMRLVKSDQYKVLNDQLTVVGWMRTDSDLLDSRAIKAMKTLTLT
jgi:HK97 family phage major capsid protein